MTINSWLRVEVNKDNLRKQLRGQDGSTLSDLNIEPGKIQYKLSVRGFLGSVRDWKGAWKFRYQFQFGVIVYRN